LRIGSARFNACVITLRFDDGTILLEGPEEDIHRVEHLCVRDPRVRAWRAPARAYAEILRTLHGQVAYRDEAQAYDKLELSETDPMPLRPYQQAALEAWTGNKGSGVVVLPTGAGKSYVAIKAILAVARSAIVLAPTIDLVHQWAADLERRLGVSVGRYGGGDKDLRPITFSTYDSGILIMPHYGNRFGLLICDECHHLPAGVTSTVADCCIAPYRLGLTATPERTDGMHDRLSELIGPEVHRSQIGDLEGRFLANYQAEVIEVAMDGDEFQRYQANRSVYLDFVRSQGINFGAPDGWTTFIQTAARAPHGREVMAAYREQRRLSRASRAKLRVCWELLQEHAGQRTIIFTDDNDTAYRIGRQMILAVLTHHTKSAERKRMLAAFRSGELPVLVTSRVLNEGVDVPEASVGIVVSGTGTVREHVQRLGRILRPQAGKQAVLYELISAGTGEAFTSERRRSHVAFGQASMDDQGWQEWERDA
jgi:superfamily II DNA or RNA helicase